MSQKSIRKNIFENYIQIRNNIINRENATFKAYLIFLIEKFSKKIFGLN
jgi:hypothetical protein